MTFIQLLRNINIERKETGKKKKNTKILSGDEGNVDIFKDKRQRYSRRQDGKSKSGKGVHGEVREGNEK